MADQFKQLLEQIADLENTRRADKTLLREERQKNIDLQMQLNQSDNFHSLVSLSFSHILLTSNFLECFFPPR